MSLRSSVQVPFEVRISLNHVVHRSSRPDSRRHFEFMTVPKPISIVLDRLRVIRVKDPVDAVFQFPGRYWIAVEWFCFLLSLIHLPPQPVPRRWPTQDIVKKRPNAQRVLIGHIRYRTRFPFNFSAHKISVGIGEACCGGPCRARSPPKVWKNLGDDPVRPSLRRSCTAL